MLKVPKILTQEKTKVIMLVKRYLVLRYYIGVDIKGLPYAIHITTPNVKDRQGAIEMVMYARDNL